LLVAGRWPSAPCSMLFIKILTFAVPSKQSS
jgi:hypothetical protein